MRQYRMQRLNGQLRDEISKILLHEDIKDPRISTFLSINRVEITKDLRYAKVFVSSFLSDAQLEKGVDGLNSAAGFIQCVIAKKLRIYQFPKLTFYVDKAMKDGFRMVETLNALERQSKERESQAAENVPSDD
ncbi:MAG: 30S ribosome-binding factor RbfA [Treponema sp.]|nr:30S ribosome-binding factor RbfA [Treponema sp.]